MNDLAALYCHNDTASSAINDMPYKTGSGRLTTSCAKRVNDLAALQGHDDTAISATNNMPYETGCR